MCHHVSAFVYDLCGCSKDMSILDGDKAAMAYLQTESTRDPIGTLLTTHVAEHVVVELSRLIDRLSVKCRRSINDHGSDNSVAPSVPGFRTVFSRPPISMLSGSVGPSTIWSAPIPSTTSIIPSPSTDLLLAEPTDDLIAGPTSWSVSSVPMPSPISVIVQSPTDLETRVPNGGLIMPQTAVWFVPKQSGDAVVAGQPTEVSASVLNNSSTTHPIPLVSTSLCLPMLGMVTACRVRKSATGRGGSLVIDGRLGLNKMKSTEKVKAIVAMSKGVPDSIRLEEFSSRDKNFWLTTVRPVIRCLTNHHHGDVHAFCATWDPFYHSKFNSRYCTGDIGSPCGGKPTPREP